MQGSAEVVYAKRSDAFAAHKRYNNVQLDGRPMRIEVASPNSGVPVAARVNVVGGPNGKATRRVVMTYAFVFWIFLSHSLHVCVYIYV